MLRLPLVPPPYCTRSVSPWTTVMRSRGIVGRRPRDDGGAGVLVDADGPQLPGAEPADLHVAAEPDAEQAALLPGGVLFPPQARVVGEAQRLVERLRVLPRVVLRAACGLVGEPVGRDEVSAADLAGVDPPGVRHEVHHPLQVVGRLGAPGPPIGTG